MTKQLQRLGLLAAVWWASTVVAVAGSTTLVTVTVPVGATLTINGHPTAQMTAVRQFVTPELPVGPKYRYIFEATFTWYGEEVVKRKQVDLVANDRIEIDMMLAETIVKPVVREEAEPMVPVEPSKPEPKPLPKTEIKPPPPPPRAEPPPPPPVVPNKPEPKKPEKPKTPPPSEQPVPDPRVDQPQPTGTGKNVKPKPDPNDPENPKRPEAPKPREVRS